MPYEDLEEMEKKIPKQELNHHIKNYLVSVMGLLKRLDKSISSSTNIDEILEKSLKDLNEIEHRTKGIVISLDYKKKHMNM